jgi:hypothetical protein
VISGGEGLEPEVGEVTPAPNLSGLGLEDAVERVCEWFFENFEDPVHNTPYDSESGYVCIWGSYDTAEALAELGDVPDEILEAVVGVIEAEGWMWVPADRRIRLVEAA